jgi:hypothetical protein
LRRNALGGGFFPIADGKPLLPISAVQIPWINLIAAGVLALPLSLEAMEPNLMRRPPRRPDTPHPQSVRDDPNGGGGGGADGGMSHQPFAGADRGAAGRRWQ